MDKVILLPNEISIAILRPQYNIVIKTIGVHIVTIDLVIFFFITG